MDAGYKVHSAKQTDHQNGDVFMEFYALGEHWRSDLAFYQDEIRFLTDLMANYFHHFLDSLDLSFSRRIENRLAMLDRRGEAIADKINRQLHEISQHLYNGDQEWREVMVRQGELEDLVALFAKDFRKLKKQVFSLTEEGLREFQKGTDNE
ncbi:hypothetical protein DN752_03210 [Echinicola strongylocentroti]|uniref:Uncharacterized protein n=1 Tax=Echinicola strongylocentroti TaxID=1795355 RepID=A0A2Z4IFF7_9BACT|nr:hypothetical protein [Echinicola strongylocentroti]AWW29228.1 hypothetical protein DN752_03210 [Echinicola strongylocentroti]